jgi:hypothetical protein
MPVNKLPVLAETVYTIFDVDHVRKGTARQIIDTMRRSAAKRSPEVRKLTTAQYAAIIISDADYHLPAELFKFLQAQPYDSEYDRALRYLSEMSSTGIRILATNSRRGGAPARTAQ